MCIKINKSLTPRAFLVRSRFGTFLPASYWRYFDVTTSPSTRFDSRTTPRLSYPVARTVSSSRGTFHPVSLHPHNRYIVTISEASATNPNNVNLFFTRGRDIRWR